MTWLAVAAGQGVTCFDTHTHQLWMPTELAARLAAPLIANPDIAVRVDGRPVDPGRLVEGEPIDIPLDDLPP